MFTVNSIPILTRETQHFAEICQELERKIIVNITDNTYFCEGVNVRLIDYYYLHLELAISSSGLMDKTHVLSAGLWHRKVKLSVGSKVCETDTYILSNTSNISLVWSPRFQDFDIRRIIH